MSTQPPPGPPQVPGGYQPPPGQQPPPVSYQAPTAGPQTTAGGQPTTSPLQRLTGEATPGDETNGFALASFVLGITSVLFLSSQSLLPGDGWLFVISLLVPISGGALGYYALQQTGAAGAAARGRQFALAGMALAAVGAVILLLTYIRLEAADGPLRLIG